LAFLVHKEAGESFLDQIINKIKLKKSIVDRKDGIF